MIVEYKVSENDFLQLNLFFDKESGGLKHAQKTNILWRIMYMLVFIILFIVLENYEAAYISAAIFLAQTISFAFSYKSIRLKEMQRLVKLRYEREFNQVTRIEFGDQLIKVNTQEVQTTINISQLETIYETKAHLFLKF